MTDNDLEQLGMVWCSACDCSHPAGKCGMTDDQIASDIAATNQERSPYRQSATPAEPTSNDANNNPITMTIEQIRDMQPADPYAGIRQFSDPATELKALQASNRVIGRIMEAYFDGQHKCQVSDRVRLLEILRKEIT